MVCSLNLRSVDELRPDAVAYSATMSACEKAWQWKQVLMLLTDAWKIVGGWMGLVPLGVWRQDL